MDKIRVAIAGVGNCASSLVQGLEYYKGRNDRSFVGLMHARIGDWGPSDIEIVAAFDIDRRKVGKRVEEAIFAKPNCTKVFQRALPVSDVVVQMGPILDGVASHMAEYPDDEAFRPSDEDSVDVVQTLIDARAEVLVCYMPVGSEAAVRSYARACLEAGVAMVNCVPVFIASDPQWAEKFRRAALPIVGDDIKSQVGATIVHRTLTRLFGDRGVSVDRTYQLNTGGNTDFLNMKALDRLKSKKTLQDGVRAVAVGRTDGFPGHSYRAIRLRAVAGRQQDRLHPDGRPWLRGRAVGARAQVVGSGFAQ